MVIEGTALPKLSPDAIPEAPFYIPATGPLARPRLALKHDDTFMLLDTHGDVGATAGGESGLFNCDTRFLSHLELLLNGMQPLLLGSSLRDDNTLLTIDLTNSDMFFEGRLVMPKDTLHVVRTVFLWRDTAYQRLAIRNHGDRPVELRLTMLFDSDFADVFEVRGLRRENRGSLRRYAERPATTVFSYNGLDARSRQTKLHFDPPPSELTATTASYRVDLPPDKEGQTIILTIGCGNPEPPAPTQFLMGFARTQNERRQKTQAVAAIETSNGLFNEVLRRSFSDLYMLVTETPQGRYPYAGIPWYSATFGRDGLITAIQMLWFDPNIAQGVLRRLAAFQAKTEDSSSNAQPGKILHELRQSEMAALREVPFGLYYGSIDSTPLFVMLAGLYAHRTGDWDLVRELWPAIEAALDWIDRSGDLDGDGFIEYRASSEQGFVNQGWRSSVDANFHADGVLAEGPIALAEVQCYVYAAKLLAGACARRLERAEQSAALEVQAARLADRFEAAFWCPELETYAPALDGSKRPCRVRTSVAGHALFTGIATPERARCVGAGLLRDDFFSGWGIRTVSSEEVRYNPMSYHNGSVWPHDNALIALGLAKYGLKDDLNVVFRGLFEAATSLDLRRLPELICGFTRRRGHAPTRYPVAGSPQAVASATPFTFLEGCLGLEFDSTAKEIRLRNPRLPSFLDEIMLHNLRLKEAVVDLKVRRHEGEVTLDIIRTQGQVQVSIVP
jgi:glycogen debranching enzyme